MRGYLFCPRVNKVLISAFIFSAPKKFYIIIYIYKKVFHRMGHFRPLNLWKTLWKTCGKLNQVPKDVHNLAVLRMNCKISCTS